ncbi:MAG: hypothetical protein KJO36_10280 [Acidimicrobiia bacterium]|nr:hypothetical protein [Acidimicrobiia bacterium]NNC44246.1 hypothetical protein [Acidimicrobiia bacterium]NND13068.1 hypothetical protein [Acidimicrobiia bacterium]
MNRIAIVLLLALGAAACGGQAEQPGSAAGSRLAGQAELAPDFSLSLDDGSTFVLSEATSPTYLVFWAEW